jgi:hypothetical protein
MEVSFECFLGDREEDPVQFTLILSDAGSSDTAWEIRTKFRGMLSFQARGYSTLEQVEAFVKDLQEQLQHDSGRSVLDDYDHAGNVTIETEAGPKATFSFVSRIGSADKQDSLKRGSLRVQGDRLELPREELQKICQLFKDWWFVMS